MEFIQPASEDHLTEDLISESVAVSVLCHQSDVVIVAGHMTWTCCFCTESFGLDISIDQHLTSKHNIAFNISALKQPDNPDLTQPTISTAGCSEGLSNALDQWDKEHLTSGNSSQLLVITKDHNYIAENVTDAINSPSAETAIKSEGEQDSNSGGSTTSESANAIPSDQIKMNEKSEQDRDCILKHIQKAAASFKNQKSKIALELIAEALANLEDKLVPESNEICDLEDGTPFSKLPAKENSVGQSCSSSLDKRNSPTSHELFEKSSTSVRKKKPNQSLNTNPSSALKESDNYRKKLRSNQIMGDQLFLGPEVIKCIVCQVSIGHNISDLKTHYGVHILSTSNCPLCSKKITNKISLKRHILQHQLDHINTNSHQAPYTQVDRKKVVERWQKEIAKDGKTDRPGVTEALEMQVKEAPALDGKRWIPSDTKIARKVVVNYGKKFKICTRKRAKCVVCQEVRRDSPSYWKFHFNKHIEVLDSCPVCSEEMIEKNKFMEHLLNHQIKARKSLTVDPTIYYKNMSRDTKSSCMFCGTDTLYYHSSLVNHFGSHYTSSKTCTLCSEYFESKIRFLEHAFQHYSISQEQVSAFTTDDSEGSFTNNADQKETPTSEDSEGKSSSIHATDQNVFQTTSSFELLKAIDQGIVVDFVAEHNKASGSRMADNQNDVEDDAETGFKKCFRKRVKCVICNRVVRSSRRLLFRHYGNHIVSDTKNCPICSQLLQSRNQLMDHILWHQRQSHLDLMAEPAVYFRNMTRFRNTMCPCVLCRKKLFCSYSVLMRHFSFHYRKGAKCALCLKAFSDKSKYLTHLLKHQFAALQELESGLKISQKQRNSLNNGDTEDDTTLLQSPKESLDNEASITSDKNGHTCDSCQKTVTALDLHVSGIVECPQKCGSCGEIFHTLAQLLDHKAIEHQQKGLCTICNKNYSSVYSLKKHMKLHEDGTKGLYTCNICDHAFLYEVSLREHMVKHDDPSKWHTCEYCGIHFLSLNALKNHCATKHKVGEENLVRHICDICGENLSSVTALRDHKACKHLGVYSQYCKYCNKGFYNHGARRRHEIREHTKDFPYPCSHCLQKFIVRDKMLAHAIKAHGAQTRHLCDLCGTYFASNRAKLKHLTFHDQELV